MPRPSRDAACLDALMRSGGAAEVAVLAAASSRSAVRACLAAGHLVSIGGGWVVSAGLGSRLREPPRSPAWHLLPEEWSAQWPELLVARSAVAASRRAALAGRCAALHRGWAVLVDPASTELATPHGRKARNLPAVLGPTTLVRRRLTAEELAARVTSPVRTVLDCAATLPFREALAIADSALRAGAVSHGEREEAAARRHASRAAVLCVVAAASGLAANPFESALRALLVGVEGASFTPQLSVPTSMGPARVDLGDGELRIAVEADSYLFHGGEQAFARDIRRYNALVAQDWAVLRVSFRDLMTRPEVVRDQVQSVVWARLSRR